VSCLDGGELRSPAVSCLDGRAAARCGCLPSGEGLAALAVGLPFEDADCLLH
jgi:hypothetical protein